MTSHPFQAEDSFEDDPYPLLKENNVSAVNWGFVKGKTNTIYAWGDVHPEGEEPEPWFHDIIRPDKTPFSQEEIDVIRKVNGKE